MFRLLAFLCVGIYAAMLALGQDHGQLRLGLMQAKAKKAAQMVVGVHSTPQAVEEIPVIAATFVPEKPLMAAPTGAEPQQGKLFYIAAQSANVREGPGKDHAVIDRLPKGEAVLVLEQGQGPDGWSLIRIEGDGLQGYVATRLLTD